MVNNIPGIKSIIQNINSKPTNVILGLESLTLWGSDTICDYIGQFKYNISPLSFFQVNPIQTEVLYGKTLEYADLSGNETVFDAYCGTGSITLFLSQKSQQCSSYYEDWDIYCLTILVLKYPDINYLLHIYYDDKT